MADDILLPSPLDDERVPRQRPRVATAAVAQACRRQKAAGLGLFRRRQQAARLCNFSGYHIHSHNVDFTYLQDYNMDIQIRQVSRQCRGADRRLPPAGQAVSPIIKSATARPQANYFVDISDE